MLNWNDLRGGLSECGREIQDSRSECLHSAVEALNTGEGAVTEAEAFHSFVNSFAARETSVKPPCPEIYDGLTIERLISAVEKVTK